MEKEEYYLRYLDEVKNCFVDIFQSGFDTVNDSTLMQVARLKALAKNNGMSYLSELCNEFEEKIKLSIHTTKCEEKTLTMIYFKIIKYIKKANDKVAYDNAKKKYL